MRLLALAILVSFSTALAGAVDEEALRLKVDEARHDEASAICAKVNKKAARGACYAQLGEMYLEQVEKRGFSERSVQAFALAGFSELEVNRRVGGQLMVAGQWAAAEPYFERTTPEDLASYREEVVKLLLDRALGSLSVDYIEPMLVSAATDAGYSAEQVAVLLAELRPEVSALSSEMEDYLDSGGGVEKELLEAFVRVAESYSRLGREFHQDSALWFDKAQEVELARAEWKAYADFSFASDSFGEAAVGYEKAGDEELAITAWNRLVQHQLVQLDELHNHIVQQKTNAEALAADLTQERLPTGYISDVIGQFAQTMAVAVDEHLALLDEVDDLRLRVRGRLEEVKEQDRILGVLAAASLLESAVQSMKQWDLTGPVEQAILDDLQLAEQMSLQGCEDRLISWCRHAKK